MKSFWKILLALIVVLVVVLVVGKAVLTSGSKPSQIRYPSPNGFNDIVKATESVIHLSGKSTDPTELTSQDRAWLIESNRVALKLVRDGLGKDILVVIPKDFSSPGSVQYLMGIKGLSQLLAAEADVAAASADRPALLSACLDNYDLGSKGTKGGRWIEGLVGVAMRMIALRSTVHIVDSGDAALCRKAALRLYSATTNAPSASDYHSAEMAWQRTLPFSDRFSLEHIWQHLNGENRKERMSFFSRFDRVRQREAETLRDLAATAFRLEHHRDATNWTELVPEYLPEIPRYATNNAPLPRVGL